MEARDDLSARYQGAWAEARQRVLLLAPVDIVGGALTIVGVRGHVIISTVLGLTVMATGFVALWRVGLRFLRSIRDT